MRLPSAFASDKLSHSAELHKVGQQQRELSILPWSDYFDARKKIEVPSRQATFNVYQSGLDGDDLSVALLLIHGAGTSGLSWALFTKALRTLDPRCVCVAPDLRGHGRTHTEDDADISTATLVADMQSIVDACIPSGLPLCVVGHSLGGSIATRFACKLDPDRLKLLVIIDLSEGNAMSARKSMERILQCRPSRFDSMDAAVRFLLRSGQVRNVESARVSAPGYFCNSKCDTNADDDDDLSNEQRRSTTAGTLQKLAEESSDEAVGVEDGGGDHPPTDAVQPPARSAGSVRWRVQLNGTSKFWDDWFVGLSSCFLELSVPKMLILSSLQKLDTELTIGQMRGQFQLKVFPQSGHALNEDMPRELAETIAATLRRNQILKQQQ